MERIYRAHRDSLVRYLTARFGRGPPDPEDIAQAAFVKLASAPVVNLDDPRAYLFTLACNLTIDHRRQIARQTLTARTLASDEMTTALSPENVLMAWQRLALFERALETMPRLRRRIFLLIRIDGLTPREVALRFGISENAVHKHVSRALLDFAAVLEKAERRPRERR